MQTLKRRMIRWSNTLILFAALALSLLTTSASAQLLPPVPPLPSIDPCDLLPPILDPLLQPLPLIADRPVVIPPLTTPGEANLPVAPERPASPDRPSPPQSVKDLVKDFQAARQNFLSSQQELLRQLKGATQEQRAAIREQLKDNLNEWREAQKIHLQELREQARDLIDTVPAIRDVVDSGRDEGRGR
jgi:gas vesicle protein